MSGYLIGYQRNHKRTHSSLPPLTTKIENPDLKLKSSFAGTFDKYVERSNVMYRVQEAA